MNLQLLAHCCKRYMLLTLHFSTCTGTPSLLIEIITLEMFFSDRRRPGGF